MPPGGSTIGVQTSLRPAPPVPPQSAAARALSAGESRALLDRFADEPALVLAVSGGPDSMALLLLAARWRAARKQGPTLYAVTVDHGLRKEASREAAAVKRFARTLGVGHRTLHWTGRKPKTGLQAAARQARYRLLADAARVLGATHVLTAHTLDDQAETVLIRLSRGSGIGGLGAMARDTAMPVDGGQGIALVRPLLGVPKARLLATLDDAGVTYADDPTNRDPAFARVRFRAMAPALEREGLTASRLSQLARRLRRADAALEEAAERAIADLCPDGWPVSGPVVISSAGFHALSGEVRLRVLGRAIACTGDEGPVELGKLEDLLDALDSADRGRRFRRTLAGAVVTLSRGRLAVERAPRRRTRAPKRP